MRGTRTTCANPRRGRDEDDDEDEVEDEEAAVAAAAEMTVKRKTPSVGPAGAGASARSPWRRTPRAEERLGTKRQRKQRASAEDLEALVQDAVERDRKAKFKALRTCDVILNHTFAHHSSNDDRAADEKLAAGEHRRTNSDGSVPSMLGGSDERHDNGRVEDCCCGDEIEDLDEAETMDLGGNSLYRQRNPFFFLQTEFDNSLHLDERKRAGTKRSRWGIEVPLGRLQKLAGAEPGILRSVADFLQVQETVQLTSVCHAFLAALQGQPLRLDQLQRVFDVKQLAQSALAAAAAARPPFLADSGDKQDTGVKFCHLHPDCDAEFDDEDNDIDDDDEEEPHPDDEEMMLVAPSVQSKNGFHIQESTSRRMTNWTITGLRVRPGDREEEKEDELNLWDLLDNSKLVRLIMTGDVDAIDANRMANCHRLECFDAGVSCGHLENAQVLRSLPRLSHLYVRNTRNLVSANFVPAGNSLAELSLYMCRNLEDISALRACPNLTVLDLGGCHLVRNVDALAACTSLEKLSIADCARVPSIDPLRDHPRLFHLDISGCALAQDLSALDTLPALAKLKLKRCDVVATEPLLGSTNPVIALEAKNNIRNYKLASVDTILPQLIRRIDSAQPPLCASVQRAIEDTLDILSAYAFHEGLHSSTTLATSGIVPILLGLIANPDATPISMRRLVFQVVARVSQTREAVPDMSRHGAGAAAARELHRALCKPRTYSSQDLDIMQYCASIVLFIAAVQGERERLVQGSPHLIACLVRLVQIGPPETVAEAAGALWNLAASLEIGSVIAATPGAIAALAAVLQTGTITAKLQASGALRNLAILDTNKDILANNGVLEPLINIVRARVVANATVAREPSLMHSLSAFSEDETMLVIKATATLRILATRECVQLRAGALGAVAVLVGLLSDREAMLRRQTCGALLALSFNASNRAALLSANAVPYFIRIVDASSNESMVISAAGCLWNLAMHADIDNAIFRDPSAIPALVRRLDSTNPEVVCRVAGAMRSLAFLEFHKELVVMHGGVDKLVRHINLPATKALTQVLSALRLVASGPAQTRLAIVRAGAIPRLAQVVQLGTAETVYLALSTLAHLAPDHAQLIVKHLPVSHLVALYFQASSHALSPAAMTSLGATASVMSSVSASPSLVREDAGYILQRIAMLGPAPHQMHSDSLIVENAMTHEHLSRGLLPLRRIRGVPGDVQTANSFDGTMRFFSYATVGAFDRFVSSGKVFYEIEIVKVTDAPSFGWSSCRFAMHRNYLSDYGLGFPCSNPALQDSWAVDGQKCRRWPGETPFGTQWTSGDVLTVAADIDAGEIFFGLNGSFAAPMGLAFSGVRGACSVGITPAISASQGTVVRVNLGHQPMRFGAPAPGFVPFCT
ncbi:Ryanodine receptor 1 [Hondaea fermentalgiana]|uniref:Vacuolar protein 8 n=1 Tax=Hondaea fermentalgiana TaxID=2315210 RepID=A0A2R5GBB0_9STRA|nr:Ryanodine receptor 1 [Hondaea fermentalgiana]|eukprot:GBG27885.1 Ryanodine receptor 1 [Hondaea fermentalgiana]